MDDFLKENDLALYGELPMTEAIMNIREDSSYDARTQLSIDALIQPAVDHLIEDIALY